MTLVIKPYFNVRVLIVFSDPGGAKPLLSFARKFNSNKYLFITDREYEFFDLFGFEINYFSGSPKKYIKKFIPDIILTGTSYTSNIEKHFIDYGKKSGIKTITYIDHTTNIKQRFTINNQFFFPDEIYFCSENALNEAKSEGLQAFSKLTLKSNYYLEFLKNWTSKYTKNQYLNLLKIRFNVDKIFLYAPDPLTNLEENPYCFNEFSVFYDLYEILELIGFFKSNLLLINLHANQNQDFSNLEVVDKNERIIISNSLNINHAIYHSDLIIGIFSTVLIEAETMNKKTLSYFPNNKKINPLREKTNIIFTKDKKSLMKKLKFEIN